MGDWFDEGASGKPLAVEDLLDSVPVHGALMSIVSMGALLSIGLTSDGGALGVTVTVDGRWKREYFRDAGELEAWLAEALPAVRLAVEARLASGVSRGRPRRSRGL